MIGVVAVRHAAPVEGRRQTALARLRPVEDDLAAGLLDPTVELRVRPPDRHADDRDGDAAGRGRALGEREVGVARREERAGRLRPRAPGEAPSRLAQPLSAGVVAPEGLDPLVRRRLASADPDQEPAEPG